MKKIFALALAALAALVSCQKESNSPEPQPQAQPKIVFELTANYSGDAPATKAIKTGWETGDVIFVFFEGVEAPKHLQMRYDGTAWTTVEMNGDTEGAIGLSNGNEGLMRALYLPFGSDSKISSGGSSEPRFFIDNRQTRSHHIPHNDMPRLLFDCHGPDDHRNQNTSIAYPKLFTSCFSFSYHAVRD